MAVGSAPAREVHPLLLCAGERILALLPPHVPPHDEELHAGLHANTIVDPVEPVVVPAKLEREPIDECILAEVDVSESPGWAVPPRADHQVAPLARRGGRAVAG